MGRSTAAKNLDNHAILLAVVAHIRHTETNYNELLARGWDRGLARNEDEDRVDVVLTSWKG